MQRCCPHSCKTGAFTREDCKSAKGYGTCIYPNDAQCDKLKFSTVPNDRTGSKKHVKEGKNIEIVPQKILVFRLSYLG